MPEVVEVETPSESTTSKLPWRRRLCYSVGHVQNDVVASLWFTYLLVFFEKVLLWPASYAGYIMLIGQVADAVSTPVVGYQADKKLAHRYRLCRYGTRKMWHLAGTLCVLLSCPFIFSPCVGCSGSDYPEQLAYYAVFVVVFQFGWAAVQVSHLSLIPDMTENTNERTGLIASRYTFTVMANILIFCSAWIFLRSSSGSEQNIGPQDSSSFQYAMAVGLGVGVVCSLVFHLGVPERVDATASSASETHLVDSPGSPGSTTPPETRKSSVKSLLTNLKLYQVAGVYMSSRLFANLTQVYTPLYLQELKLGAQSVAIIPLVMFLSGFSTSLIVKVLNKYLGRQGAYAAGSIIGLGGCLWVSFGSGETFNTYEIYPIAILLGASSTIQVVTSLGLTADLIGAQTESGAFVYGAMSFTDKLSNGVVVVFLQNFYANHSKETLAYVGGGSSILGLAFVATLALQCLGGPVTPTSAEKASQTEEKPKEIASK